LVGNYRHGQRVDLAALADVMLVQRLQQLQRVVSGLILHVLTSTPLVRSYYFYPTRLGASSQNFEPIGSVPLSY
jgi:hypothetical protein